MWGVGRDLRLALCALCLTLAAVGSLPALAAESVVTDIRVGQQGPATRVVFEMTKQIPFTTFPLGNPNRVVIDLPEVGWRLPARPLPGATGVFNKLRYGLFKPGNSRVVLDVRAPAAITQAFILEPEGGKLYRLVIELTPTTDKAFLQSVGKAPVKGSQAGPAPVAAPGPGVSALAPPETMRPQKATGLALPVGTAQAVTEASWQKACHHDRPWPRRR